MLQNSSYYEKVSCLQQLTFDLSIQRMRSRFQKLLQLFCEIKLFNEIKHLLILILPFADFFLERSNRQLLPDGFQRAVLLLQSRVFLFKLCVFIGKLLLLGFQGCNFAVQFLFLALRHNLLFGKVGKLLEIIGSNGNITAEHRFLNLNIVNILDFACFLCRCCKESCILCKSGFLFGNILIKLTDSFFLFLILTVKLVNRVLDLVQQFLTAVADMLVVVLDNPVLAFWLGVVLDESLVEQLVIDLPDVIFDNGDVVFCSGRINI